MKKIEVLGPGCPRCQSLEASVKEAVKQLGIQAEIVKVTEIGQIAARGVMSTPAIVVDGNVMSTGRVPDLNEIKEMLHSPS